MTLFSERYNYVSPSKVIIREQMTQEIQNAICTCFDRVNRYNELSFNFLEKFIWVYFFNQREGRYRRQGSFDYKPVITSFIEDDNQIWYKKLDMVELTSKYLVKYNDISRKFDDAINYEFQRLNFAYRLIDHKMVEITSKEEIVSIENALESSCDTIKNHLSNGLSLLAQRPEGDYSNSIKESISAVEVLCRQKTGANTLGKALKQLQSNDIVIPQLLNDAFVKLYAYTNQGETGIRHALMDETGTYKPTADEAIFMLVSCSAFINYLNKK